MSLADKLNYLKQTKNLIKQAINNKGGTLTTDSSFRSYADEINNIGSTMTATADDIMAGKTAISNGGMITGTSEYNVALIKGNHTVIGGNTITRIITKVIDLTGITFTGARNLSYLFNGLPELLEIKNMPSTVGATDMSNMFSGDGKLTSIPQLSTSKVTTLDSAFNYCQAITELQTLDLAKCTNLYQTFYWCRLLENVTFTNANAVTNLYQTFYNCSSLKSVSDFGTGLVTNLNNTFFGCSSLTQAPYINTSSATSMYWTFYSCNNLTTIPQYDTSRMTRLQNTFYGCPNLSNESLNNILAMCINSNITNTSYKKLSDLGLTSAQATICQGLSNYQDFINAGWTTGY